MEHETWESEIREALATCMDCGSLKRRLQALANAGAPLHVVEWPLPGTKWSGAADAFTVYGRDGGAKKRRHIWFEGTAPAASHVNPTRAYAQGSGGGVTRGRTKIADALIGILRASLLTCDPDDDDKENMEGG